MVTNNATVRALNGSVIESYALFVNNGTIDISGGSTNFHGGLINNGTITTGGGNVDSDGDGFTDAQEALAGTNPTNAASYLHILAVTPDV